MEHEPVHITVPAGQPYSEMVRECKRQLVVAALAEVNGNTKRAAQRLGIARQNLYRLMRDLDIQSSWRRRRMAAGRIDAAVEAMQACEERTHE